VNSWELKEVCLEAGFNLTGIISVESYDRQVDFSLQIRNIFFEARSAILLATGGSTFWSQLSADERKGVHPIDVATIRRIKAPIAKLKRVGGKVKAIFPFRSSGRRVSFMKMGEMAGLGCSDTLLGILIHPTFGPWVSMRSLLLTNLVLTPDSHLSEFLPCAPCAKPCVSACPVSAFRTSGFEARLCGNHLTNSFSCDTGCLSRRACVYGRDHAYGEEEGYHRQKMAKNSLVRYVLRSDGDSKL